MERTIKATTGDKQPIQYVVVDEKQAAAYVNLSVKTLQARRAAHKAPAFLKIGRSIRYRLVDLDAFLAAHRIDPEANA
ncbi:helix-turn-helix domain-containing protein [Solidesulfovibrio alcoholivorans]|uniref:helix-turn-helix domain-containing protein n=1 Tax=Solidesulfovibrio alcoholivorans TaxID=81406 RepID=UPI0004972028|nr:helix-turn-helix domain-containing protein [Solidesulfovibrio alcoholivorans]